MTAKKSRSASRTAKTGTATGTAKTGKSDGKISKTLQTGISSAKMPRTKATGHKVARGSKQVKSRAGTTGRALIHSVRTDQVHSVRTDQADKLAVTGRLVKLDAIDRDGARTLEQVMTGVPEVRVSTGAGKTTTLTGALLGVLRNVASALKSGESITLLGEDAETDLGAVVISSQEAADLLNVSRPFVVKLAKTGQLAHHLVGNRHRFSRADVLAYAGQMRSERSRALTALSPAGGYSSEDF